MLSGEKLCMGKPGGGRVDEEGQQRVLVKQAGPLGVSKAMSPLLLSEAACWPQVDPVHEGITCAAESVGVSGVTQSCCPCLTEGPVCAH